MKLYNSLTRQKEQFCPIEANKVKMYVCGQTVYDFCHLGHARKAVVFDMIRRWFIASGYEVTFVENITDIDDKIIKRAVENNETIEQLTSRFITYMHQDFDQLGIMRPDMQPRATNYIRPMLDIISNLIAKGFAYQADNGDVYYCVQKFANYGKLSGKSLEELKAGERVELDNYKKYPMDFVLWKAAKAGEPFWESEFGPGRPGWHIECSAMSQQLLGKNFDIHGGGQDLQFPHHENEIAQSEAHNNCNFANYWLHNGFLNINDEKMSKSLNNFFILRQLLAKYDAEIIRFFMLKTHYRSPLNFNEAVLEDARTGLSRLYTALKPFALANDTTTINWDEYYPLKFKQALDDDFNTPLAISILHEIANDVNKQQSDKLAQVLLMLANTIGLLTKEPSSFFQEQTLVNIAEIEQSILKRNQAKLNRDYVLADKIRDQLFALDIILEDTTQGTIWRKK